MELQVNMHDNSNSTTLDIMGTIEDNDIYNCRSLYKLNTMDSSNYNLYRVETTPRLDLIARALNSNDVGFTMGTIGVLNRGNVYSYTIHNTLGYISSDSYKSMKV